MDKFFEKEPYTLEEIEHTGEVFNEELHYHSLMVYMVETEDGLYASKKKLTYPQVVALLPNPKQVFVFEETIYMRVLKKPTAVEEKTTPVAQPKKSRRNKQKPQA